jgi:hypothetical protein
MLVLFETTISFTIKHRLEFLALINKSFFANDMGKCGREWIAVIVFRKDDIDALYIKPLEKTLQPVRMLLSPVYFEQTTHFRLLLLVTYGGHGSAVQDDFTVYSKRALTAAEPPGTDSGASSTQLYDPLLWVDPVDIK